MSTLHCHMHVQISGTMSTLYNPVVRRFLSWLSKREASHEAVRYTLTSVLKSRMVRPIDLDGHLDMNMLCTLFQGKRGLAGGLGFNISVPGARVR
jgi:hypothetical protein